MEGNINECRKKLLEAMIKAEPGSEVKTITIKFENDEAISDFIRKQNVAKKSLSDSNLKIEYSSSSCYN